MGGEEGVMAADEVSTVRRPKLRTTILRQLGAPDLAEPASHRLSDPNDPDRDRELAELPGKGDVVDGHYKLLRELGRGMFGCVYEAERTDIAEHRVALKVLDRAVYGGRDVDRELVMLAAASHPHIVELKDHGVTPSYVWLTMPYYQGETLEERLTGGPLELDEAHEIFLPIARGLQALHARGLRHQDLKPENIFLAHFVDDRIHPLVLDLGVAVEANSDFVAGTVLYAAPEQLAALTGAGKPGTLGERIDTYCLTATLLHALVGDGFFPGASARSPFDLVDAFEERESTPLRSGALPELSGEPRNKLIALLRRGLAREPSERPTMKELADELDVLLEQGRAEARAEALRQVQQRAALQRGRVAVGMLLLAGAGIAAYAFSKRETWRLATELEKARAEGAQSFDELDTCVAAHQVTQRESRQCAAARSREKKRHEQAVAALASAAQGKESGLISKVSETQAALWALQDDLKSEEQTWTKEKEKLEGQLAESEKSAKKKIDALTTELADLTSKQKKTAAERASCTAALEKVTAERDSCRAGPYESSPSAAPAPEPTAPPPDPAPPPAPSAPAPTPDD
jgi:hypothetical protein